MGETADAVNGVYDQLTLRRSMLYDNIYDIHYFDILRSLSII